MNEGKSSDMEMVGILRTNLDPKEAMREVMDKFNSDYLQVYKFVQIVGTYLLQNQDGEYVYAINFIYDIVEKYEDIAN